MTAQKACFLDRDGVLVALLPDGRSVRTPEQVRLLPGAAEAVRKLREAGLLAVVITNQPGPALGTYSRESVEGALARMHELLRTEGAAVDSVYVCLHHPEGGPGGDPSLVSACDCRKPKPGMLLRAAAEHGIDLERSFFVGDMETDVQAGQAAGCTTIRIGAAFPSTLLEATEMLLSLG